MNSETRHIVITDRVRGLPYSKGLMASSLTISGLPTSDAFRIAEKIEEVLHNSDRAEISSTELRRLAAAMLEEVSEKYSSAYLKWQMVEELERPLVILLGGATGVGKSTVATQLAARLGITRVISTDAIREVLRSALSPGLMPTLHVSSFDADLISKVTLQAVADRVIVGFQEQVQAVAIGIKALITRALEEGTDIIVEGAHVVPGFLDGWEEEFREAVLVPIVMTVGEEELHRSHFHMRALETKSRPHDRYLSAFDKIRAIQVHINHLALERGVPVVEAIDLDTTLQEIISIVVAKALTSATPSDPSAPMSIPDGPEEAKRKPARVKVKTNRWELAGRRKNS